MISKISSVALVAGAVMSFFGAASAAFIASPSGNTLYEEITGLSPLTETRFVQQLYASTDNTLSLVTESQALAACEAQLACVGVAQNALGNFNLLFPTENALATNLVAGLFVPALYYKYGVDVGACVVLEGDVFGTNGLCICGSLRINDGNFGCRAALQPSTRFARNKRTISNAVPW